MADEVALAEADLSTLRRMERLPFARFHWRLLWMGGLGYTFDAMDGAMIAFILPAVSSLWGLTNQQTGVLASSAMIGYLFGAFLAGTLGDLIGRRAVMMHALAIYSLATLVAAFAPSWQFLFWWRRSLPESPRWLIQRGRSAEATAEVERIEAPLSQGERSRLARLDNVEVPRAAVTQGGTFAKNLAALWSAPMARTTLMLWV